MAARGTPSSHAEAAPPHFRSFRVRVGSGDMRQGRDQGYPLVIASTPATGEQRRTAILVLIVLVIITASVVPFAHLQLVRIDVFVPVLQTVLTVADLITVILLFAQYSIQPLRGLLALGCAYLCSASFAFLQTLAFPGAYAPAGLIGDGTNTAAWFFVLWHVTFPLGILTYALLKDERGSTTQPVVPAKASLGLAILFTFAAIAALAWLVTAKIGSLPAFYKDDIILQTKLGNQVNIGLFLWYGVAFLILLFRRRTILDVWLIVVLAAWMPNFLVAALASSVRFSVGWYASRGFALVASFMLLSVLLTETTVLYSRLANALSLLRREHSNRLMSVDAATGAIAHELRSPLGAVVLNVSSALSEVRSEEPDLGEIGTILEDIGADTMRANEVITTVRALFKEEADRRTSVRVEEVARHALDLAEPELKTSQVELKTDFLGKIVHVHADAAQLQQAILNLIRNAIDAMSSRAPGTRELKLSIKMRDVATVVISIQDTGSGIPAEDRERIFDAFFTKKASGMGLGLAISRTIVERQGGTLRLQKSDLTGSTFEIELPTGPDSA